MFDVSSEDHVDSLERMRDEGLRCRDVALAKSDQKAVMIWQKSLSRIEALLIENRARQQASGMLPHTARHLA